MLDYLNDDLKVDMMQISPAYAYEKAPDQEHFLGVERTREIFSQVFADGKRRSGASIIARSISTSSKERSISSARRGGFRATRSSAGNGPCYLMSKEGYASTYKELLEETDWSKYGRGKHESCENCMAHCGYEPTAVIRTTGSIKESLRAAFGN